MLLGCRKQGRRIADPGESALDDPVLGLDEEAGGGVGALDDRDAPTAGAASPWYPASAKMVAMTYRRLARDFENLAISHGADLPRHDQAYAATPRQAVSLFGQILRKDIATCLQEPPVARTGALRTENASENRVELVSFSALPSKRL